MRAAELSHAAIHVAVQHRMRHLTKWPGTNIAWLQTQMNAAMYINRKFANQESEEESPVHGLSAPLFKLFLEKYSAERATRSPIGGLSLPEYERLCGKADD